MKNIKLLFLLLTFISSYNTYSHGGGKVGIADVRFHITVHIGFDGHTEWGIGLHSGEHKHSGHGGNHDHGNNSNNDNNVEIDILGGVDDPGSHHDHDGHHDYGGKTLSEALFFAPIVYGGFERFEHVINLGSHFNPDQASHSEHGHEHEDHHGEHNNGDGSRFKDDIDTFSEDEELSLEINLNENNYFKRIKAWNISVGAGLALGSHPKSLASWGGGVHAHLVPTVGKSLYTERIFKGKRNLKNLSNLKVPKNLDELNSWKIGEAMSYNVHGGISFHAGLGWTIFTMAGPGYHVAGEWTVSLKKVGDNKLMAMIGKSKVHSFMLHSGMTLTSLHISAFKNKDENFGFLFDFSKPGAVTAYRELLKGKLKSAQELALNIVDGVRWVRKGRSSVKGKGISFSGNIPFLAKGTRSWGEMQTFSKELEVNKRKVISHVTMVTDEMKTSGVISRHKKRFFYFLGGLQKSKNLTDSFNIRNNYAGTFKWLYQNEKTSGRKLRKEFSKLTKRIGLKENVNLEIPEGDLGFVRASVEIQINQGGVQNLLNEKSLINYSNNRDSSINEALSIPSERKAYCKTKKFFNACKKIVKRRTLKSIKKGKELLSEMKEYLSTNQPKKFSKS
ncbi:MAG: hypothetical protein VXW15_05025, partial [Bdellovibrionota bacterium]|nr:hypothetical protein [Bdellovibrionota bacterium]